MTEVAASLRSLWRNLFLSQALDQRALDKELAASLCTSGQPAVTLVHATDGVDSGIARSMSPRATVLLSLVPPSAAPMSHSAHGAAPSPPTSDPQEPVPEAQPMRTVDLADGASFQLDLQRARRTINGQEITGITYGGSFPGPVLRVQQGSTLNLLMRNRTDNETTLHSHGLRLDWRMDGVPHLGQHPVAPGAEFNYRLTFPDAGVYWYHPHVRDWAIRGQGAYGVFLVQPTDPKYYNPVNREEVLALQDLALQDPSARDGGRSAPTHVYGGLYGDTMLVNGRTDYSLHVKRGDVVRFHILNAADARVFNLAFPGARVKVIGSDVGRNEREAWADSVMISPAERYTVEVLFDTPGRHEIVSRTPDTSRVLGTVEVDAEPTNESHLTEFERLRENRDVQAEIDQYRGYFDRPPDRRLVIDVGLSRGRGSSAASAATSASPAPHSEAVTPEAAARSIWERTDEVFWEEPAPPLNRRSNADNTVWKLIDADTGAVNQDIQWTFNQGEPAKIEIQGGPLQHPIHFHGQRFLVLSINGVKNPNLQWKDTVLIPAGQTAEILLDNSNAGKWMFHCHIGRHALDLDHPNHRMTGFFEVRPRPGAATLATSPRPAR